MPIGVYQEVYLYCVWLQGGPLENTLHLQTTPILKWPPLALTLAHLSLFGGAVSSTDDWWREKTF